MKIQGFFIYKVNYVMKIEMFKVLFEAVKEQPLELLKGILALLMISFLFYFAILFVN